MPDIAMCLDHSCPSRLNCRRYTSLPSVRQTYAEFERPASAEKCDAFVQVRVTKATSEGAHHDGD